MPFVRIDLPAATPADDIAAVSQSVHQAMVDVIQIPPDDRFQVIGRRAPGELVCTPRYLGIEHSDRVVFVQITLSPGRAVGLKEALFERIARDVARSTSFAAADVIVNLVESALENWSFGNGVAQYAVLDRSRPAAS